MVRAICFYLVVGSVLITALGPTARAQNAPRLLGAAPAQSPEHSAAPATEATPEQKAARSRSKDAEADSHTPAPANDGEPDHIRGLIAKVEGSSMVVKTSDGKSVRIGLAEGSTTIIGLSRGRFSSVDFGTYVGAVAVKLDEYSPIVRDSAVWLHKGYELRVIDEDLRGIALGHRKWDLAPDTIISHGWVDDIEVRVLSIKWGPTDYDETDVEVPRDAPVLRMSLGDKSLIKPGAHVFAGAKKDTDGNFVGAFVIVGKDGIVPPL